MPALAPIRQRSPMLTTCLPPPESVPMIEAPPPTSEPSPTTTPAARSAPRPSRRAQRAGVEVARSPRASRWCRWPGGRRAAPGRRRRSARRRARRSRSSAGTCRRRTPAPRPVLERAAAAGCCSKSSTAHGPELVHTTLISTPKRPSRFMAVRRDETVREQVQAQVGVRGVGRAASRSITVRTTCCRTPRRGSLLGRRDQVGGTSYGPPARRAPRAGAGYQVSRTDAVLGDGGEAVAPGAARAVAAMGAIETSVMAQPVAGVGPEPGATTAAWQRTRSGHLDAMTQPAVDSALDSAGRRLVRPASRSAVTRSGLADAVEAALRGLGHLEVIRDGNTVVARTQLGRAERVVLAGHLDTVPLTGRRTCRPGARARSCSTVAGRAT